jgi:plastocyanin
MRRTIKVLALATMGTVSALVLGVAPAAAGGGCHSDITSADARGDQEATVEMVDACFTPTTLQVDPGTQISFVSRDAGITHNVGGNLWGNLYDMHEGDAFRVTFDQVGVYPYACSYHPGMTGAIIVGNGMGAASGESVSVRPYEQPDPIVVTKAVAAEGSSVVWMVAGIAGLALGAAGGIGLARTRRSRAA